MFLYVNILSTWVIDRSGCRNKLFYFVSFLKTLSNIFTDEKNTQLCTIVTSTCLILYNSKNDTALYCIVNVFCYSVREYVFIKESELCPAGIIERFEKFENGVQYDRYFMIWYDYVPYWYIYWTKLICLNKIIKQWTIKTFNAF